MSLVLRRCECRSHQHSSRYLGYLCGLLIIDMAYSSGDESSPSDLDSLCHLCEMPGPLPVSYAGFCFHKECGNGIKNRHRQVRGMPNGDALVAQDKRDLRENPAAVRKKVLPLVFGSKKEKSAAREATRSETQSHNVDEKINGEVVEDDDDLIVTLARFRKLRQEESDISDGHVDAEFEALHCEQDGVYDRPDGKERVRFQDPNGRVRRFTGKQTRIGVATRKDVDNAEFVQLRRKALASSPRPSSKAQPAKRARADLAGSLVRKSSSLSVGDGEQKADSSDDGKSTARSSRASAATTPRADKKKKRRRAMARARCTCRIKTSWRKK